MPQPFAALPLLMVGVLVLAGCDRKPAKPPAPPPQQVGVLTLQPQSVPLTTELPGRTTAVLTADVRPQVNGLITERRFTEGSNVTAGQQLYQIDPASYRASYDSALATLAFDQAALRTAQAKAARYRPLAAAQAISKQDADDAAANAGEAAANILSAKAGIESAKINLDYTRVTAPISGRIGRSGVTPGALVTANQASALATITQLDPMYVDVAQPAATLLRLRAELAGGKLASAGPDQARVKLKLEDGTDYPVTGTLEFSEVNVDQTTGTVILRAVFPNKDGSLLPGLFVREELSEGVASNALLIPQQAVSRTPHGDPMVLLVGPDNKAVPQVITTDRAIGDRWLVTGGVKPGDRVIVDGLTMLRPGMPVRPVAWTPGADVQDGAGPPGADQ